ncbi:MAG: Leucineresponsive regulatory protein [Daejeonella sp.]|nr:Leucineresponsive regulatory protein [Daejeonella sp.]
MKPTLDNIDLTILKLLQQNSRKTLKDISHEINLSLTPTHDRVKRLENDGFISKYVGILDRKKLGIGLIVHCQVTLDKQTKNNFTEFEKTVLNYPEVVECSMVSGSFDYLLKLVIRDMDSYNQFYQQKLAVLSSVAHISTLFVIQEIKSSTELPLSEM